MLKISNTNVPIGNDILSDWICIHFNFILIKLLKKQKLKKTQIIDKMHA